MRISENGLVLSATDLGNFLGCRHRTGLDMAAAKGELTRPVYDDPLLELLQQRGLDHERRFIETFRSEGKSILDLASVSEPEAGIAETIGAMRSGVAIIVQGALGNYSWYGKPDILERIEVPSELGGWSYQAIDTKLARDTRAGAILQLCLYSALLSEAQGRSPEHFYLVTPDPVAPRIGYRFDDYAAYFRLIQRHLEATVVRDHHEVVAEYYPEPVEHCEVCAWRNTCNDKRHADDHLSLVAGITRLQRRELARHDVGTVTRLAKLADPLPFEIQRGSNDGYRKVQRQASVQVASRGRDVPLHELIEPAAGIGLSRLPPPSPGDVFLDLEGDPFAREGGREYLFGVVTIGPSGEPIYRGFWGLTDAEEKAAFEAVIDLFMESWGRHQGMHVYHYAPYEPAALKRLMGRYAARADQLDRLLRGERFVDLYAVVRQGVRVGVESYSIKRLEPLYGYRRRVDLDQANRYLRVMETALWRDAIEIAGEEVRAGVEGYNRDDCLSTLFLRDWLEARRADLEASHGPLSRPVLGDGLASDKLRDDAAITEALRARLLAGVPSIAAERSDEQRARWLLGYSIDWHQRENKPVWWEYFRLRDLPEDELFDEPQAVAGLEFVDRKPALGRKGKATQSVIDQYRYPEQDIEIQPGDKLKLKDGKAFGHVTAHDRDARTIDIKKGSARRDTHPISAFKNLYVDTGVMEEALRQLAERVAESGISPAEAADRIAVSLLRRDKPRLDLPGFDANDPKVVDLIEIVNGLDGTTLAIQGPPGSGKTYSAAKIICALVGRGTKVGVIATSHSVITNLLEAVDDAAKESRTSVRIGRCDKNAQDGDSGDAPGGGPIRLIDDYSIAEVALKGNEIEVLGGTAWLWAREEFAQSVDALFVDEAGQMSLANVLAVSRAAKALILLGDPQQLEQPIKGTHPDGADSSALQHLLGDHQTLPPDRGIFLPITRRLPPSICGYTSEAFYEGRLTSLPGLERQRLSGAGEFDGNGFYLVEVEHDGNRNYAEEEIGVVERLVQRLTAAGASWTNVDGKSLPITPPDILVVAPYNAQVNRLARRLKPSGVAVGTVDKFQGQEAPVVIYSMATSRPEDAPRGLEFLYSANRLNVATSRARCAAILVASPRLFEPECRSPRQMKLANALCRFRELAKKILA